MGSADLQAGTQEPLGRDPTAPNDEQADISALREENARLAGDSVVEACYQERC